MTKTLPTLHLSSKTARVLHGHPWAYTNELAELLPPELNGSAVELKDARGRSLGTGLYNGKSQIAWRRFSRRKTPFDRDFLAAAIPAALSRRDPAQPVQRLIWSEADSLPGLVVDRYAHALVAQMLTLGMDTLLDHISDILCNEIPDTNEIIFRNDAPVREKEGLPLTVTTRSGADFPPQWFSIDGLDYFLDLQRGHKTGFYLDQRQQHATNAALASSRHVLDAFTNQGAFALHCARAGAATVTAIDSSKPCITQALQNAERNGLSVDFLCANMFDWFTHNRDRSFDLIILDPPSFAPNKRALEGALRGYKELNLRALRMLNPGGILATYTCSQHVDAALFLELLRDAAADARRDVRILEATTQAPDHPVLLTFPESQYLDGFILEVG